jgi:hypothetical protein
VDKNRLDAAPDGRESEHTVRGNRAHLDFAR